MCYNWRIDRGFDSFRSADVLTKYSEDIVPISVENQKKKKS